MMLCLNQIANLILIVIIILLNVIIRGGLWQADDIDIWEENMSQLNVESAPHSALVAEMFGVSVDAAAYVAPQMNLELKAGEIMLITGPSGCGKSTLLRHIAVEHPGHRVLCADAETHERRAIVDCFSLPLEQTLALLSRCGLSEAGVLLRPPGELSCGQRFRYELARCIAAPEKLIIADEFCSVLDRTVACVICWQLRKLIRRQGKMLIAATTHEDIAGDLSPEHWLQIDLGGQLTWVCGGGHVQYRQANHH